MRREKRNINKKESNTSIWITGGVLVVAILTFVISFIIYSNQLDNDIYTFDSEYLAQYENNIIDTQDIASASSSIGKNVEELVHFISTNYDTTKDKISLVKGG